MNNIDNEPKCVIISAGDFQETGIDLREGDLCIAADAGFGHAQRLGILPDLIVGDFDSAKDAPPEVLCGIREITKKDPERVVQLEVMKDDTDTMRAVRIGLSKGYRKFCLYGAMGGKRLDHSLANIQTLLFIKHQGGSGYIIDRDLMLFIAENETVKFPKGSTGTISVFSLSEESRGVSLKGLLYGMDEGVLKNDFPLGVSNEFIPTEEAAVSVKEGTLLISVMGA